MKALSRNKQVLYYALNEGISPVIDEDGLHTGEFDVLYGDPVKALMNVSPASGRTNLEQFGIQEQYDKVLVTDDMNCPIKEDSVLWVDTLPIIDGEGKTETPHDYIVIRVSRSLNSVSIAIKRI